MTELYFRPIKTKSGVVTCEVEKNGRVFLLHSKYDPEQEAYRFIKGQNIKDGDTVLVYGFGLGYHIRELLKNIGEQGTVYVVEPNAKLFREALKYIEINSFLSDKRLKIIADGDLVGMSKKIADLLGEIQLKNGHLLIHRPSLEITPDWADPLKQLFLEWQVKKDTLKRFAGQLEENLMHNREVIRDFPGVTRLLNKFHSMPVLLVGAGPSLDSGINMIRDIKNRCLIISVGTALRPLLSFGINPDLVIITDPQPIVKKQVEGLQTNIPLVAFPTVHPTVLANYPGIKLVAYQSGIDMLESMAQEAGEELIDTGGSVATAALDIAIRMRCNPVMFAGVDLGYARGKTHADGTMYGDTTVKEAPLLYDVLNNQNEVIKAPLNHIIYRKWIERRIEKAGSDVKFFNLSPDGAAIKGAPYISWDQLTEKYLQADQTVAKELLCKICSA